MSSRLPFLMAVLNAYSEITEDPIRETVTIMRIGGSPMENASFVENLAQAVWMAVRGEGLPLAPPARIYFLGRPFDDGEVRLIVLEGDQVIFNDVWISTGRLRDWLAQFADLAEAIRSRAQRISVPYNKDVKEASL